MKDKQLNIRLTEEEHRKFKIACAGRDESMQDVGAGLIAIYLLSNHKCAGPISVVPDYVSMFIAGRDLATDWETQDTPDAPIT